jgi:cysteine desulfurase
MADLNDRPIVYLDYQASTPVDPRVAKLVFDTMNAEFGNAHSVDHAYGHAAAALVDQAAIALAEFLHTSANHVLFTSGATEAIRIALEIASSRTDRLRVAVSRVEHKAVLAPLRSLDRQGRAALRWIDVDHVNGGAISGHRGGEISGHCCWR